MSDDPGARGAAGAQPLISTFARVLERAGGGEAVFGERLMVLRSGPLPVPRGVGAALALDERAAAVLVAALSRVTSTTGVDLGRHLDEVARLSLPEILAVAGPSDRSLEERHAGFFDLETEVSRDRFNAEQRIFVLTAADPSLLATESLVVELGSRLAGIYRVDGDMVHNVELPPMLRPLTPPDPKASPGGDLHRGLRSRERAGQRWIAAAGLFGGIALVVAGIAAALSLRDNGTGDAAGSSTARAIEVPVRRLTTDVPAGATNSYLIAQQRVVRAGTGRLLALYPTAEGVAVLEDQNNQGRSWRSPVTLPGVEVTSLSVAIDSAERLHVAALSDDAIKYWSIRRGDGAGWSVGRAAVVDTDAQNPATDIAWDGTTGAAHVVWVKTTPAGSQPMWALVDPGQRRPRVVETSLLAPGAGDEAVLVNVAVVAPGRVIVSYRRADSPEGWFARSANRDRRTGRYVWGREERLPFDGVAASASLVADRRGTAHLVLRDDERGELAYLNKSLHGGWTTQETAATGAPSEIDSPALAVDAMSQLVYLFFQSVGETGSGHIKLAIRDPASGWEGPYDVTSAADPAAALFPTTVELAQGQAIVLWTRQSAPAAIEAARVTAP